MEALEQRDLPSVTILNNGGLGYAGLDFNQSGSYVPPDTNGAAGPTNYVETVNQTVAIYSPKATGASAITSPLDTFWFVTGGLAHADSRSRLSDPVITYDDQIGRFIVGDQDVDPSRHKSTFDIAVSNSSSPGSLTASDWNFYHITTTESGYDADFPGNFGYNHDAFVVTLNMFSVTFGAGHCQILSLSNSDLANSVSQSSLHFYRNDLSGFDDRPTVMHDSVAGDPMWLVTEHGDNQSIDIIKMTAVLSTSPTFSYTNLAVTPYSPVVNPLNPNGTVITNNIGSEIQKSAEWNGVIVAIHNVAVSSTQDVAQWYAINVGSGTPALKDQGRISAGNNTYITYPAIDINSAGQIGVTYMKSGTDTTTDYMSMYVVGRSSSDPAGTMEASVRVPAGTGQANYKDFSSGGRAGDLSGINVDPSDGTFWAANEFANTEATANWGTAIANFTISNPGTTTHLDVTPSVSSTTAGMPFSVTMNALTASNTVDSTYRGTVHFTSSDSRATLPADYTFVAADNGVHTFTNGVTLVSAGSQSVIATDTVSSTITGSAPVTVNPAAASTLIVAGFPSSVTAGTAGSFTVTAKDSYGNTATGHAGTVTFSSSDLKAALPANYTFTSGDAGVHTFSVILRSAGSQSITAKDTVTSSISGSETGITVNPGLVNHLILSRFPSVTTAGVAQSFRITAQDLYGNTVPSFTDTVAFSSTDPQAVLAANYTFTSTDAGIHNFLATLKTAGTQSLTAKDITNTTVTSATRSGITVNPLATSQLQISGFPTSVTAGTAYSLTVTALDPYGNTTPAYRGTVNFTSSDAAAVLPANYTFTSGDAGMHNFTATLNTGGTQSITVADTVNAGITGTQSGIRVVGVQPTAGLTGPTAAVTGQPLTYTLNASESGLPANTAYSFSIQWGDASPVQTLSGPSGTQVGHVFTTTGTYTVSLTATDPSGNASVPTTMTVAISTVLIETDPYNSSLTALYVGGTLGNDTIAITPVVNNGVNNGVMVGMNFVNYGSFTPTGHVVVYGQSGNDIIKTAAVPINGTLTYVNVPLLIFAGNGNDILNVLGSMAGNVLVGGAGSDNLYGGLGRDIEIGGSGPSSLHAGSGGDILIGGTTDYDTNAAALAAVLAEWGRTDADYTTRIAHLNGSLSGGLNGSLFLNSSTVHSDGMVNNLYGGPGLDWFFAGMADLIFNHTSGEVVTQV